MRIGKSIFILSLVLELAACGQLSTNRSEPSFKIYIEMTGREHTSLDADSTKEKLARGAGQGAAAGASAGVLLAVMCGPFFMLCLPASAGAGTVIGGGTGATAGFKGLPEEIANSLNDDLLEMDDRRDFRRELLAEVVVLIPENGQASQASADLVATIRIMKVEIRQHRKRKISVFMRTKLKVEQTIRNRRLERWLKSSISPEHHCSTPKRDAEEWLNDEQDTIDKALTFCVKMVSESISAQLMKAIHY